MATRPSQAASTVTAALLLAAASERLAGQAVFPSAIDLVAVDVTVVDRDGRPLTDLRPEDFEIKVGGRRRKVIQAAVTVEPGTYRLKVAAATAAGRVGSVERSVEARLHVGGGLSVSDILVVEPDRQASGTGVCVDGRTTGRAARAMLEVRGAAAPPSVQLELAADGSVRWMTSARVQPTGEPGVYSADAPLDLASLDAGRYDLQAVVLLGDGTEAARVSRPMQLPARR